MLIISACEKQRFLQTPIASTKYVVNGLFSTNEPCLLEISTSQALNDTSTIKNVGTAEVFLYEGDRLLEKLSYSPPILGKVLGSYTSEFKNFLSAKKYSINVEVDGKQTITASDIIPTVGIDITDFSGPGTSDTIAEFLNFEVDLKQNSNVKQYVHLLLQQRWVQYNIRQGDSNFLFTTWFSKSIYPTLDPLAFIPSSAEPFSLNFSNELQGVMMDNQNFINSRKSIKFLARNYIQQLDNIYLESRLIVRSVSANYFKYYFSSSQYYRTKGVPLSEPVIIHNNIINGLGNFSCYSSDTSLVTRTYY